MICLVYMDITNNVLTNDINNMVDYDVSKLNIDSLIRTWNFSRLEFYKNYDIGDMYERSGNVFKTLIKECKSYSILSYVLDHSIDLEATTENGWRPIHFICKYGSPAIIRYIIDKKVDLECRTNGGMKPIHFLCQYSTHEMIKYLIGKGVDLECIDSIVSPLHLICYHFKYDTIKFMVEKGANINRDFIGLNNKNYTMTDIVKENKFLDINETYDIIQYILQNTTKYLDYTKHRAIVHGIILDQHAIRQLLRYNKFDLIKMAENEDNILSNFFKYCVDNNVIKHVIDNAINLEAMNLKKCRPIHFACGSGDFFIIKYLVEKGINLECEDIHGWRPIHYVCKHQPLKVIKYLISKGVNLEAIGNNLHRPVHVICEYGKYDSIIYLIDKNVKLDVLTSSALTPKDLVKTNKFLNNSDKKSVELLIETKLQMDKQTKKPITALLEYEDLSGTGDPGPIGVPGSPGCSGPSKKMVLEQFSDNVNVIEAVIQYGNLDQLTEYTDYSLRTLMDGGETDYFKTLIQKCVKKGTSNDHYSAIIAAKHVIDHCIDLEYKHACGIKPIHIICEYGPFELIKYVIEKGVDIECATNFGWKPVHFICRHGDPDSIEYIIGKGVDLECRTKSQWRPIHFICRYKPHCLDMIIDKHIDLECYGGGWCPIHFICRYGPFDNILRMIDKKVNCNKKTKCNKSAQTLLITNKMLTNDEQMFLTEFIDETIITNTASQQSEHSNMQEYFPLLNLDEDTMSMVEIDDIKTNVLRLSISEDEGDDDWYDRNMLYEYGER